MASFSDVETVREIEEVVDQQAKACDAEAGALAAATVTEENDEARLQQEQHDGKAPVLDHQEASAPEHAAAVAPAAPAAPEEHAAAEAPAAPPAPEEHDDEKQDQAEAKKEEVEPPEAAAAAAADDEYSTRERLKRHRREMAGRVWVPEMWGQEKLLKDWVDCAVFDRPMVPTGLLTARRALIADCCTTRRPDRRTSPPSSTASSSPPLRVRNGCS
ncbi:unnamed protein product [Miscanthus lutarioriparius]|uniref:Uncharacterized protein n=1 Tax=Miscanthus lutarioriparius TaxID=422564 RepID=A0A811QRC1_9POAL|nr:unnamed protein product [Miscanthus lutarioriparius]